MRFYKAFKIGKVRFAVNIFPKTAKGLSDVYRSGMRNWEDSMDKNYSLVLWVFRVIISVGKPVCACCHDAPSYDVK